MREEKDKKRQEEAMAENLVNWGALTPDQAAAAEKIAREKGISRGRAFFEMKLTPSPDIYTAVSETFDLPYIDLADFICDREILPLLTEKEARNLKVLPLIRIRDYLMIAMIDPFDITSADRVAEITGLEVGKAIVDREILEKVIDELYGGGEAPEKMIAGLEDEFDFSGPVTLMEGEGEELQIAAPIADLLSTLIKQAVRDRASDIHINPEKDLVQVKFRVDGVLQPNIQLPKKILNPLVSHIKVLSNLDISVSMRPQDGEFHSTLPGTDVDVRVSVLPTIHGENAVMRILNAENLMMDLGELGFSKPIFEDIRSLITRPHGIILITGPTGSGKTTTLYSLLSQMDSEKSNIITVEDPAEYKLAGIRQVQVNPRAGLTFATALRSIVRQDPDIIMIGEIRDLETAEIAVQSALTGHLVLGTLHTNDAPSAVTRLVDMGVQPFLVASSVIGIMAQRLVRLICPFCKEAYPRDTRILQNILAEQGRKEKEVTAYHGRGCPQCAETGYRGRTCIAELMAVDDKIRELIVERVSTARLIREAREKGMKNLFEDGLEKVIAGETTLEEINRVVEMQTAI